MLFSLRKRFRVERGFTPEAGCASFAPVAIAGPAATEVAAEGSERRIEIAFASGARMTVTGVADPALVMAVAKALARR
jgi:hypothetical protein